MKVSVNRWIVFNWNFLATSSPSSTSVSVNRWIVFNWNWLRVDHEDDDDLRFS